MNKMIISLIICIIGVPLGGAVYRIHRIHNIDTLIEFYGGIAVLLIIGMVLIRMTCLIEEDDG